MKFSVNSYVNELSSSEQDKTLQFLSKEISNTEEGICGKILNTVLLNEELDAFIMLDFMLLAQIMLLQPLNLTI